MSSQLDTDKFIKETYETLASRYVLSCILVVIGYDYLLTLSQEISLVWRKKFRLSTLLFFAIRYGAGGLVLFELVVTPATKQYVLYYISCDEWLKFIFSLQIAARAGIVVVFVARSYAICYGNRIILAILSFLGLVILVLDCAQEGPLTCYTPSHSVVSSEMSAGAASSATSRVAFDLIVVGITIYRTVGILRLSGRFKTLEEGSTTSLILGNGLFYFFMVTLAELTVVVFVFLPRKIISVKNIADPVPLPLACILITRFLLDLRNQERVRISSTRRETQQSTTLRFETRAQAIITEDFGDHIYNITSRDYLDEDVVLGELKK